VEAVEGRRRGRGGNPIHRHPSTLHRIRVVCSRIPQP
jgi:hypothetical protein